LPRHCDATEKSLEANPLLTFRPSRRFNSLYLATTSAFAWVTFSDDWHAWVNDGTATTALSIAGGAVVAAAVLSAARVRR
jgi:hypothetical protein